MAPVRSVRQLVVWRHAMKLVRRVYRESSGLPPGERFGLQPQLRRCAVSIPSNVAEGWGRRSRRDYVRFLRVARGSTYELSTQLEICHDLGYPGDWRALAADCEEVARVLHSMIDRLQ